MSAIPTMDGTSCPCVRTIRREVEKGVVGEVTSGLPSLMHGLQRFRPYSSVGLLNVISIVRGMRKSDRY